MQNKIYSLFMAHITITISGKVIEPALPDDCILEGKKHKSFLFLSTWISKDT